MPGYRRGIYVDFNLGDTIPNIDKLKAKLRNPRIIQQIARAGAQPVDQAIRSLVPVGDRENRRYRRRKTKGKWNRPSKIWQVTQAGNLKDAHAIVKTSYGVALGPHVNHNGGARRFAYYAYAVHKLNHPWLRKAYERTAQLSTNLMKAETKKIINLLTT